MLDSPTTKNVLLELEQEQKSDMQKMKKWIFQARAEREKNL